MDAERSLQGFPAAGTLERAREEVAFGQAPRVAQQSGQLVADALDQAAEGSRQVVIGEFDVVEFANLLAQTKAVFFVGSHQSWRVVAHGQTLLCIPVASNASCAATKRCCNAACARRSRPTASIGPVSPRRAAL